MTVLGLKGLAAIAACIVWWPKLLRGEDLPEEDIEYLKRR